MNGADNNLFMQLMPRRIQHTIGRLSSDRWIGRQEVEVYGGPVTSEFLPVSQAQKLPLKRVWPCTYFLSKKEFDKNPWRQKWFRVEIPSPVEGETGRRVFKWDCRGETVVYLDGKPWASLDVAHPYCFIPEKRCTLWLDCGTYQTAMWFPGKQPDELGLRFDDAWVCRVNEKTWEAYWDFQILFDLVSKLLEQNNLRANYGVSYHQKIESASPLLRSLVYRLHEACDVYETRGLDSLKKALGRIYAEFPAENWQLKSTLAGHAHIDYVWLWPERVTHRKIVHTFATMAHLMDYYPEFRFTASSPAHYEIVSKTEPELARRIKGLIRRKRWEATGATWIEPDTHMPCGEGLARCMAYGQRYFKELRGSFSRLLFLPDVFGYTASLPQIMKLGGVEFFATTKLSWSHLNRFPFTSFIWRGNDGTEIPAHLVPGNYNNENPANDLNQLSRMHAQSHVHPEFLTPVGIGDGGGGTTVKAIEMYRRLTNLARYPRAKWGSMEDFCARLVKIRKSLPVYDGELYLELHRATYTTQSEYKLAYRRTEMALQAYEAARVVLGKGPIERAPWDRLACAQFHDALPGSSIEIVYKELGGELKTLAAHLLKKAKTELEEAGTEQTIAFNPLAIRRNAVFTVPAGELPPDRTILKQSAGKKSVLVHAEIGGLQGLALNSGLTTGVNPEWIVSNRILSNGITRAEFDARGRLVRLTIQGEPVRLDGPCGFMLYEDRPADFDAWDIDQYSTYLGKPVADRMTLHVVEKGPVRAIVRGEAKLSEQSTVEMSYILEFGCPWLKAEARIVWNENFKFLKFHFPTNYRGKETRYGCPFGSVLRPQLPGSPEAEAMWEVPASRWAALSDDDGTPGLAVVTEAKYGFSCRNGNLGLSLLKAPKDPDPTADRGLHTIRFALGRHRIATEGSCLNTAAAAETLFAPVIVAKHKNAIEPMVEFEQLGSMVPSWILPSETGHGFILRMHETMGGHGKAVLSTDKALRAAEFVDFLERPIAKARIKGSNRVEITYSPHKIVSLAVR